MPALGILLGIGIRKPEASQTGKPWFYDRWFYYRFIFGSVLGYGTGVVCYLVAPDWMWMYILDSQYVSWPLLVYVSVMYHVLLFAGLLTSETMLTNRRVVWRGVWLLLTGATLIGVVWFQRLWFVGTITDFYHGQAEPMIRIKPFGLHAVGIVMVFVALVGAVMLASIYYKANKQVPGK